jgi:hypothetical protein
MKFRNGGQYNWVWEPKLVRVFFVGTFTELLLQGGGKENDYQQKL